MKKLVILNQRIIDWEKKGEIKYNYFNPNKKFKIITILSFVTNGKPSDRVLKKLCGSSQYQYLTVKNKLLTNNYFRYLLPLSFYKTIVNKELKTLNLLKPDIVRCIGDGYVGYISGLISKYFKSKLIISIHTFVSFKIFLIYLTFKEKVIYFADYRFRDKSHDASSKIIIPYSKIRDNIKAVNQNKIVLAYNYVENIKVEKKQFTKIKNKTYKLVFVGRLIKGKSIIKVIKAILKLRNVTLTIYGDGPERERIEKLITFNKVKKKIKLIGFYDNSKILKKLSKFDAFVAYHRFYEFPKTLIEAINARLPIILNKYPSENLEEFKNLKIIWTDGTIDSYKEKIMKLVNYEYNINLMVKKNYSQVQRFFRNNQNSYD
mgnify:CR=1 FL=1